MKKVVLEGYIEVSDEDLEAIKKELPNHIELTRKEKGCLLFKVEQDNDLKKRFKVYEEFETQEAFSKHQERIKSSQWGLVTKNVKRNYQIKS